MLKNWANAAKVGIQHALRFKKAGSQQSHTAEALKKHSLDTYTHLPSWNSAVPWIFFAMFGVGAGLSPKVFWGRLYCAPWAFKTAIVASWRFCVAAPKGVRPWAFGWFTLAPTFNRYLKKWLAKTGGLGSETTSTSPNKTPKFYTNYI